MLQEYTVKGEIRGTKGTKKGEKKANKGLTRGIISHVLITMDASNFGIDEKG